VIEVSELLEIGAPAPRFVAQGSDGKTYRLADLLKDHHVALIFYPGNDTPG
jgi:peroxiredoxin